MKKFSILFTLVVIAYLGYSSYNAVFKTSSSLEKVTVTIPENANLDQVTQLLDEKNLVKNQFLFETIANQKKYSENVKSGKFEIPKDAGINEIINILRLGSANVVKFTFNNIYSMGELAGKAGQVLAADSLEILDAIKNIETMQYYGFNPNTYPSMFIPNTYELNYDCKPEDFVARMAKEYKRFWNEDRKKKAQALNLSHSEIVTLASIVQAEQQAIPSEWKTIAGLYLNRVRKNIALQSDPTVKFAVGDWTIRRVLNKHLETDSPYNTYKYPGIPPGPILFPDIKAVDAVLNAEDHSYLYMCAAADFSGRHEFSKSLSVHNKHAAAYRKAMDQRKIYK